MSRSNHTEAQMIGALKQLEAGRKAEDVAREVGVSKHTIYAWKAKYGGMDVNEGGWPILSPPIINHGWPNFRAPKGGATPIYHATAMSAHSPRAAFFTLSLPTC